MHPIERLRMVARAAGEGPALLAQEAAGALAAFAGDPAGLVTACRRLVDRQPTSGPIWWLSARVLAADDPTGEAWRAAEELSDDETPSVLAKHLPDDATVCVVGRPELAEEALVRRGDLPILVVDSLGEGHGLARRLARSGNDVELVPESGLGAAAAAADLVLLEAVALGPTGFVAASGSRAAAAVARHAGSPVWVVAGAGRVLPGALWSALARRLGPAEWDGDEELVPIDLIDIVAGPGGPVHVATALANPGCPAVPELLREVR
jgi:hypothetical protein